MAHKTKGNLWLNRPSYDDMYLFDSPKKLTLVTIQAEA